MLDNLLEENATKGLPCSYMIDYVISMWIFLKSIKMPKV